MKTTYFIILTLVIAGLLGLSGCGGDPLADFTKLADKMCECPNEACADGAMAEMESLGKEHHAKIKQDAAWGEKWAPLQSRMMGCYQKVLMKEMGADFKKKFGNKKAP